MSEPISCELDRSQAIPTFDCEPVEITGEAEQCVAAPETDVDPPASVKALVDTLRQPVVIPPADVPLINHPQRCLGELGSFAILAAEGAKSPLLAGLAGFKVGWDLAKCVARERGAAQEAQTKLNAERHCLENGGEALGWNGNELQCAYPSES
jgi:hypothetical protein